MDTVYRIMQGYIAPRLEIEMEKNMEHDMETEII